MASYYGLNSPVGANDGDDWTNQTTGERRIYQGGAWRATPRQIGGSATDTLAFYNATPIAQRAGAAQTAVITTAATQTTPFGFATQAQGDAIVTLVNELRAAMVALGLIKGSA